MVPIREYEAKKGVGSFKRYAKSGSPPEKGHDLRLVGLGKRGALENARKKRHGQSCAS